jgi:hypothetical protein
LVAPKDNKVSIKSIDSVRTEVGAVKCGNISNYLISKREYGVDSMPLKDALLGGLFDRGTAEGCMVAENIHVKYKA